MNIGEFRVGQYPAQEACVRKVVQPQCKGQPRISPHTRHCILRSACRIELDVMLLYNQEPGNIRQACGNDPAWPSMVWQSFRTHQQRINGELHWPGKGKIAWDLSPLS